jgi:hypothetical protein
MKTIIILIIAILSCFPYSVLADTHTAASASYANVLSAYNAASDGDTVAVPAGTATWSSTLTLTKHISLIGGSGGTTLIKAGASPAIQMNPSADANDTLQRVSGFTFDGQGSNRAIDIGHYDTKLGYTILTRLRLDNCIFQNSSGSSWDNCAIRNYCTNYGLVDHCQFAAPATNGYIIWAQAQWNGDCFTTPPQSYWEPGTNQSIYWENNKFTLSSGARVVVHNSSGRGVYRYNTIIHQGSCQGEFELHGPQGDGLISTFGVEIYGNLSTASSGSYIYESRGGKSMVFYNTMSGAAPSNHAYGGSTFGCPSYAPEKQIIHDTYLWNNRKDYNSSTVASLDVDNVYSGSCGGVTGLPKEGRDIFSESPAVRCGTLANMPATCSVGQGYWASDQSCTDLTGMVGTELTTPISGTLYKCTATNTWTEFYTPYEYPHPLISGLDLKKPNPPEGLRIE